MSECPVDVELIVSLVNIYSFDKPEPTRSLSGHTSFVYSISAMPDGSGAVSSGEDGTLRVWSGKLALPLLTLIADKADSDLVQTISHPSNSLWSSAVFSAANGSIYIASASQDSTIRAFTRDPTLIAPGIERERWEKDVSSRQLDK